MRGVNCARGRGLFFLTVPAQLTGAPAAFYCFSLVTQRPPTAAGVFTFIVQPCLLLPWRVPCRQAELDSLRAGKVKPPGRLGGLGGSSRLAGGSRLVGLGGSSSRLAGSKRGGLDLQPVRRSGRNADKRVRCTGFGAVWSKHCWDWGGGGGGDGLRAGAEVSRHGAWPVPGIRRGKGSVEPRISRLLTFSAGTTRIISPRPGSVKSWRGHAAADQSEQL